MVLFSLHIGLSVDTETSVSYRSAAVICHGVRLISPFVQRICAFSHSFVSVSVSSTTVREVLPASWQVDRATTWSFAGVR